jgi:hypothetical protein
VRHLENAVLPWEIDMCTDEHMFENSQTSRAQSQANGRRTQDALRRIRDLIVGGGGMRGSTPVRFETRGLTLTRGLEQTFRRVKLTVDELECAIEGIRPFMRHGDGPGFAQAHLKLNRAVGAARELLPMLPRRA